MKKEVLIIGLLMITSNMAACTGKSVTQISTDGETRLREIDGMTEIYIPAGEFLMGASRYDTYAYDNKHPQRSVYLDEYWIDQHEVTNGQYALCVAARACTEPRSKESMKRSSYYGNMQYADYPVIFVNWYQASEYCAWVDGSLPTEVQWEKAARGTNGQIYPQGNQAPSEIIATGDTTGVCNYPNGNSPYGLCDMAGSVLEWVNDWYDVEYYLSGPVLNPLGPAIGDNKVLRGGYCYNGPDVVPCYRSRNSPDYGFNFFGFRCSRQP